METKLNKSNRKLVEVSTQYSKFNKNQVLTETQLNGFLDYFDDQDRLTRTSLSGVGIVCGFQVSFSKTGITIAQGRGVTTDGDLLALLNPSRTLEGRNNTTLKSLQLESKTYTHVKRFFDTKSEYTKFLNSDDEQIELFELKESTGDDHFPLSDVASLSNNVSELSNMVVLLYLESYEKEDDLCNQLTCDNQGLEQVARLRVLLVSEDNAKDIIAEKDPIFLEHDWNQTYASLPVVSSPRIVVNQRITRNFKRFKQEYFTKVIQSGVLSDLKKGLNTIFNKFGRPDIPEGAMRRVFAFRKENMPADFQYRFDAINDLIDTYNEIKELLSEMNVECCPNIGSFPKHLMLGKLYETNEYPTLRHSFYKSPIIPSDNENYQHAMSLLKRVQMILSSFNIGDKAGEIEITPSLDISILSNKSIPFYYNITDPFLKYWNFFKSKKFLSKLNLSYHKEKLSDAPSVQNPLDYNLDPFDFYRIEGHQGRPYKDALRRINFLKSEKGLNFDVKALSLSIAPDGSDFEIAKYMCHFEDVRVLYDTWRVEQECILNQIEMFFSAFSTVDPGKNWISEQEGYDDIARLIEKRDKAIAATEAQDLQEIEDQEKEIQKQRDRLLQQLMIEVQKTEQDDVSDKVSKDDIVDRSDKVEDKDDSKGVDDAEKVDDKVDKFLGWHIDKLGADDIVRKDDKGYKVADGLESADKIEDKGDRAKDLLGEKLVNDDQRHMGKDIEAADSLKGFQKIEHAEDIKGDVAKAHDISDQSKEGANVSMAHGASMMYLKGDDKVADKSNADSDPKKIHSDEKPSEEEVKEPTPWWKSGASGSKGKHVKGGSLSDLATALEENQDEQEVKEKVVLEDQKPLTKDQLAKKEKELKQIFEKKLKALKNQGESPEVIKSYEERFEKYIDQLRKGEIAITTEEERNDKEVTVKKPSTTVTSVKTPTVDKVKADRDNTIGQVFRQIIAANQGAELPVILRLVEQAMIQISQTEPWKNEPVLTEFVLKEAVKTLAISYILDHNLPRDMERLNADSLRVYQTLLTTLCEQIKDLQASFSVVNLEAGTRQITDLMINQLASICCSGKKLKVMYDEMQTRIAGILAKIRLNEFVLKHPGLEHKAGVRPGGTFVMVYLEGDEKKIASPSETVLDLEFKDIPKVESIGEDDMILQLWRDDLKYSFRFANIELAKELKEDGSLVFVSDSFEQTIQNFASKLNQNFSQSEVSKSLIAIAKGNRLRLITRPEADIEGKGFFRTDNPEIIGTTKPVEFKITRSIEQLLSVEDQVVADFSLPYMCCSDCAPVNFVIPRDQVILRLPEKHVCLKEGEPITPLPFSVSPKEGEIEAEVYGDIQTGLIFDEEGNAFFDASQTDPSLYGQKIGFKVDGEATNCTIVVYAEPEMEVTSEVEYNELKTEAKVTFTCSHVYPELKHTWQDGIEGHVSNELPDAEGNVSFVYDKLPVNAENTIKPTLTLSNGFCEKVVEINSITFEDPITEVKLEIQDTYCIDNAGGSLTKIPFTLLDPEGLTIRFAKGKVEGLAISEKNLIIDPDRFNKFYEPVEFTYGGLPTEAKITIYPALEATITQEKGDLIFRDDEYYQEYFFATHFSDVVNTEGITIIWEVNGEKVGAGKELTYEFLVNEEPTEYKVVLKAAQLGGCRIEESTAVTVENPSFKITLPENRTKFCLNDGNAYPITVVPKGEGIVVEGLGVTYKEESNTYFFSPDQTGLISAGKVELSIDGTTYLKLNIDTIAEARFEVYIENGEVVVFNNSDDADEYIFNVGNHVERYDTKKTYRRKISLFDQEVIDVTLRTINPCGEGFAEEKGITLKRSLTLPVKHVCLKEGEDVKVLEFAVIPENGKVKADVDESIQSGLIYDDNNKPFFDASLTDKKLYGKPIEFTLDGEKTECVITVYPDLPLSVSSTVDYNETKTEAKVIFQVSEVYPDVDYTWSDDQGNEATKTPDADGKITFNYKLPVNATNTVKFFLKLTDGPCVTNVPLNPITFEQPVQDFTLNIQDTFCFGDADGDIIRIPFTNIEPDGESIEIAGGSVEGLSIIDNDLQIDVKNFKKFYDTFKFTLGGNDTSAKITIYPVLEIGIDSDAQGLRWENNQLVQKYFFKAILPDGIDAETFSYKWEIFGQMVGETESIYHDFEVLPSPMGYEVRLTVLQNEGVCPIETSTIIDVEYPEFFLNIPNNETFYCFTDKNPHNITIDPPVEGFVVEGLGMSRIDAENRNVFVPNATGLVEGGSVPLSFDGLTYRTLTVGSTPQASFTVNVTETEIEVTNTSQNASEYIFNVAGEEIKYKRKVTFKRSLDLYQTDTIDITLTTKSPCGDGFTEKKGIKIREGDNPDPDNGTSPCVTDTINRIKVDEAQLPRDLNLTPDVEYTVVDQTQMQYQMVLSSPQMLNGGIFSDLITFGFLFNDTSSSISRYKNEEKNRKGLSQYFIGQVKLFFNMIHCQPHEALSTEKQTILELMSELNNVLKRLRGEQIRYDEQKELQNFFNQYLMSQFVVDFVRDFIKSPLLPEVEASNNVL